MPVDDLKENKGVGLKLQLIIINIILGHLKLEKIFPKDMIYIY